MRSNAPVAESFCRAPAKTLQYKMVQRYFAGLSFTCRPQTLNAELAAARASSSMGRAPQPYRVCYWLVLTWPSRNLSTLPLNCSLLHCCKRGSVSCYHHCSTRALILLLAACPAPFFPSHAHCPSLSLPGKLILPQLGPRLSYTAAD